MISPIRNSNIYYARNFKAGESNLKKPSPQKPLTYGQTLRSSALLGLSAMGFSTIFTKGWKLPIAIGCAFAGLMMLFNIPDKIYYRK